MKKRVCALFFVIICAFVMLINCVTVEAAVLSSSSGSRNIIVEWLKPILVTIAEALWPDSLGDEEDETNSDDNSNTNNSGSNESSENGAGEGSGVITGDNSGETVTNTTVSFDNMNVETKRVHGQDIYYARATLFDIYSDSQISYINNASTPGNITDGSTIGYMGKWNRKMRDLLHFGDKKLTPQKYPMYAGSFWEASYKEAWAYGIYNGPYDYQNESSNFYSSAQRATVANTITQGLVADKLQLVNGEGFLATYNKDNGKAALLPYYDKKFICNNKHDATNIPLGSVQENVDFPLRVEKRNGINYYEFMSNKDVARYNSGTKKLEYRGYGNSSEYVTSAEGIVSFLPFNKPSDSTSRHNFVYGVKVDIPVYIPSNGVYKGQDLKFTFAGDDDVYVFLDGNLILDLGGGHGPVDGVIDFAKQQSTVARVGNNDVIFSKRALFIPGSNGPYYYVPGKGYLQCVFYNKVTPFSDAIKESLLDPTKEHVLTMFYMDRAKGSCNLKMSFNMLVGEKITDITEYDNGVKDVRKETKPVNYHLFQLY